MRIVIALAVSAFLTLPTHAATTTSTGRVSVTQVMEIVDLARTEPAARNAVIAYLAGIGETAGLMVSEAVARGATPLTCTRSFNLAEDVAVAALTSGAPDRAAWGETAATPIILADLFARAGCK